jgi:hypothetical protein
MKTILFWVFVLVCLTLLWTVVNRNRRQSDPSDQPAPTQQQESEPANHTSTPLTILFNAGPFVVAGGFWVFVMVRLGPMSLRRLYRKDPTMQGQFTVNITPASISGHNTAGTSWQSQWSIYDYWREGKDLIVLVFLSSAYFVVSLKDLSDPQREELRAILAAALPSK